MAETLTAVRDGVHGFVYKKVLKPAFFSRDPEDVHDAMTAVGVFLGRRPLTRSLVSAAFGYAHPALEQTVLGVRFANPIGLSAGFDKDARLTGIMPSVGFGFMEAGSVTGEPCQGNGRPRLWRMPESRALVVNYGLKNEGCERVAERLKDARFAFPVGVSIAKTNCEQTADPDKGILDYAKAFSALAGVGSYVTVNISCPNAFGGQPFTDPVLLERLLCRLDGIPCGKPVFLKLSPDLDDAQVDALVDVARRHRVHGFVCANLTKDRANPAIADANVPPKGGISGKVVSPLADAQIARVYARTRGRMAVIGCGGVFTAEDAYRKVRLGASLVQMITGMIYEGPQVVSQINRGLVGLLERDGFANIAEARGADVRW